MKNPTRTVTLAAVLVASLITAGCGVFKSGAPPTKVEQGLFDVQTNIFPVLKTVTNYQQVTITNTTVVPITVTNENNVIVNKYQTNLVPVNVEQAVVSQVPGL